MNTKDDCKRQYNSKWLGIKIKKKKRINGQETCRRRMSVDGRRSIQSVDL